MVYPEQETFPKHERTTYTFAAMVLAADALSSTTPAAGLFRGEGLPAPSTWPNRTAATPSRGARSPTRRALLPRLTPPVRWRTMRPGP